MKLRKFIKQVKTTKIDVPDVYPNIKEQIYQTKRMKQTAVKRQPYLKMSLQFVVAVLIISLGFLAISSFGLTGTDFTTPKPNINEGLDPEGGGPNEPGAFFDEEILIDTMINGYYSTCLDIVYNQEDSNDKSEQYMLINAADEYAKENNISEDLLSSYANALVENKSIVTKADFESLFFPTFDSVVINPSIADLYPQETIEILAAFLAANSANLK